MYMFIWGEIELFGIACSNQPANSSVFPNNLDAIPVLLNQLCEGQKGEIIKVRN